MRSIRSLLPLLIVAIILSGCDQEVTSSLHRTTIDLLSPQGQTVRLIVELALTAMEQERGLMGRTTLEHDEGMLFVFQESAPRSFWMRDTLIPLDILFFDGSGSIVSSTTMQPCPPHTAHCPSYLSQSPARFALEVPAGFVDSHRIDREWRLGLQAW